MNFSKRHREDELMDNLQLSPAALKEAYTDIARANRFLGGDSATLSALNRLTSAIPRQRYSIVDIGCGNGAMLRKICDFFRKNALKVRLIGVDMHESAIVLAKEASRAYPEIDYRLGDIFDIDPADLQADFVISTLTLHHIPEENVHRFLDRIAQMARIGVIINDLQRSRWAYYLFKLFRIIFIKTPIARNDGLVSIRSGFTKKELLHYSQRLPKLEHKIYSKWAFRYVWVMRVKRQTTNE